MMSWVANLKKNVQGYLADRKKARENKRKIAESQSALARIQKAGEDRDASLEEALTPEELKKFGYVPRKRK